MKKIFIMLFSMSVLLTLGVMNVYAKDWTEEEATQIQTVWDDLVYNSNYGTGIKFTIPIGKRGYNVKTYSDSFEVSYYYPLFIEYIEQAETVSLDDMALWYQKKSANGKLKYSSINGQEDPMTDKVTWIIWTFDDTINRAYHAIKDDVVWEVVTGDEIPQIIETYPIYETDPLPNYLTEHIIKGEKKADTTVEDDRITQPPPDWDNWDINNNSNDVTTLPVAGNEKSSSFPWIIAIVILSCSIVFLGVVIMRRKK